MASEPPPATHLTFHHDMKRLTLRTEVLAVIPLSSLEEPNRQLFRAVAATADDDDEAADAAAVVVTRETIFHPQGGGQPSDVGTITRADGDAPLRFDVAAARTDAVHPERVLHFGRFARPERGSAAAAHFAPGDAVEQAVDAEKRLLFSRYHTAGHVVGAAVRRAAGGSVPGFDELKASHFPDSAGCEFAGVIEGRWKAEFQAAVDALVAADLPVAIEWWDEADFRARGLERLIPEGAKPPPSPGSGGEGKWRVVNIVGAEVYPCGGTHVDSTGGCGPTTVRKISRSKGTSRVSYALAP